MAYIRVKPFEPTPGRIVNQCWDGFGNNPKNLPLCPPGANAPGGIPFDRSTTIPSIAVSDAKKLQGRQEWTVEAKFVVDQREKIIDPALIKELYVEEDVFNPFVRGYIVVDSWFEGIEREPETPIVEKWVHFRNDGRDELIFELKPNKTPENTKSKLEFPDEYWSMKNKYVIYDKEDIGESMSYKTRKFYFWDKNYQLMRERKIQWSTGIGTRFISEPPKEPIAHQPDIVRSMKTGEAIASLLWDAGFQKYIDFENWDWGSTYINYSLKANETVWEALNYILARHVSEKGYDQCLFIRERFTRRYQLIPFWKIFKYAGKDPINPGPWQREHLFFDEEPNGESKLDGEAEKKPKISIYIDKNTLSPFKAPLLPEPSDKIDIKVSQWGFVTNYTFVDMSGIDSSLAMISKPVHTHWTKKNQFVMNFKNNEIKKIREDFIKPYRIDFVLGKWPLYTLNKTKTDQIAVSHRYSLESTLDKSTDAIMRLNKGKNETAFSNLFLNEALALTIYGSTHRSAGMFIGVDRYGWSDNDFDWKFMGQWYATTVVHQFLHNKYVNKLTMVKLHAWDEFEYAPDEDVI